MYVILTYSTDMRYPNYRIEYTTSKNIVREALKTEEKFSYGNPEKEKNWHKDLVSVYEMPKGWRRPTKKYIRDEIYRRRGSIYSPNENGIIAGVIMKEGMEIKEMS